jgi:hypothetical protein
MPNERDKKTRIALLRIAQDLERNIGTLGDIDPEMDDFRASWRRTMGLLGAAINYVYHLIEFASDIPVGKVTTSRQMSIEEAISAASHRSGQLMHLDDKDAVRAAAGSPYVPPSQQPEVKTEVAALQKAEASEANVLAFFPAATAVAPEPEVNLDEWKPENLDTWDLKTIATTLRLHGVATEDELLAVASPIDQEREEWARFLAFYQEFGYAHPDLLPASAMPWEEQFAALKTALHSSTYDAAGILERRPSSLPSFLHWRHAIATLVIAGEVAISDDGELVVGDPAVNTNAVALAERCSQVIAQYWGWRALAPEIYSGRPMTPEQAAPYEAYFETAEATEGE